MTFFAKTDRFLRNLYETGFYFLAMAVKENFRNYIRRAGTVGTPAPTMAILGNGPALAEELPHLLEEMRGGTAIFWRSTSSPKTNVSPNCARPTTYSPTRCSSATRPNANGSKHSTAR